MSEPDQRYKLQNPQERRQKERQRSIERRLGTGVSAHHTEDDVVEWLNRIFK